MFNNLAKIRDLKPEVYLEPSQTYMMELFYKNT